MKTCRYCKETKDFTEFYILKHKSGKLYYQPLCRKCIMQRNALRLKEKKMQAVPIPNKYKLFGDQ